MFGAQFIKFGEFSSRVNIHNISYYKPSVVTNNEKTKYLLLIHFADGRERLDSEFASQEQLDFIVKKLDELTSVHNIILDKDYPKTDEAWKNIQIVNSF